MLPIQDEIRAHRFPFVNYSLIALNIIVFIIELMAGPNLEAALYEIALIPANVTAGFDLGDLKAIFTSMFLHAGLSHLLGNMLYLWIFGDNVEDRLGHFWYLVFYLAGGVVASFAHVALNPNSVIPTVGASGAIAAVLGAYLILFPQVKVLTFVPIGFFLRLTLLPASLLLGFWFVIQLFNGLLTLGLADMGGTAFWAHIGGFVFGVLIGWLINKEHLGQPVKRWVED
ncbi:MAG TPA: rhomboid family intramembrane serine protease [Anaerolineaceae bacterium]|nr:rhomboid family intramembrane serine protease [Anaerolineaceae bacterium]